MSAQPVYGPENLLQPTGEIGEGLIPLAEISQEQVALNQNHLYIMTLSLQAADQHDGAREQNDPILLAQVDGEPSLVVVDGFYRLEALRLWGAENIKAQVQDMSWEEVIDKRMFNTASHDNAEVLRLIELAEQAWSMTEWADRYSISEVVHLRTGSSRIRKTDDAPAIVDWLKQKTERWGVNPTTIDNGLRVAHAVAPDLVAEVCYSRRKQPDYRLAMGHLSLIAKKFPGESNFDTQRQVAAVAKQHHLTVMQIDEIAHLMKDEQATAAKAYKITKTPPSIPERLQSVWGDRPSQVASRVIEAAVRDERVEVKTTAPPARKSRLSVINQPELGDVVLHSYGPVIFEAAGMEGKAKQAEVARIRNIPAINQYTVQEANKAGYDVSKLNKLVISSDGTPFINEVISIDGPIETEALNSLLVSYFCFPPASILELHSDYRFGEGLKGQYLTDRMAVLHRTLMRWHDQGLSFYDAQSRQGALLSPILIEDKR